MSEERPLHERMSDDRVCGLQANGPHVGSMSELRREAHKALKRQWRWPVGFELPVVESRRGKLEQPTELPVAGLFDLSDEAALGELRVDELSVE